MFAKYTEKLNQLMDVSAKHDVVTLLEKSADGAISDIGFQISSDDNKLNHYQGIIKRTDEIINKISMYDAESLQKILNSFISDSNITKRIKDKFDISYSYLSSSCYKGILSTLDFHINEMSTVTNVEQLSACESNLDSILAVKDYLKRSEQLLNAVELYIKFSIFDRLSKIFFSYKKLILTSTNLEDVKVSINWISMLDQNRHNLNDIEETLKEATEYVKSSIFFGFIEQINIYKDDIKNLSDHLQLLKLKNNISKFYSSELPQLKKLEETIFKLQSILKDTCFESLYKQLLIHKDKISRANNVISLTQSKDWINKLWSKKDTLVKINKSILDLGIDRKNIIIFNHDKFIKQLFDRASNISASVDLDVLNKDLPSQVNLLDEIGQLQRSLDDMTYHFSIKKYSLAIASRDLTDISNYLSKLYEANSLRVSDVTKIREMVITKLDDLKNVECETYKMFEYFAPDSLIKLLCNIIIFILNCIFFLLAWPYMFSHREARLSLFISKTLTLDKE